MGREMRGEREWRFLGVVTTVTEKRRRVRRRWIRSSSGSVWPCAGYGKTRMCGGDGDGGGELSAILGFGMVW
ncbi:hypothetical protein LINGRAHAP2_LOCUS18369, partial [Linum grandiflorum]